VSRHSPRRRSSLAHANARTNLFARRLIVERVAAGWPVAHVAEQLGISRATAHKWLRRHAAPTPPHRVRALSGRPIRRDMSIPTSSCELAMAWVQVVATIPASRHSTEAHRIATRRRSWRSLDGADSALTRTGACHVCRAREALPPTTRPRRTVRGRVRQAHTVRCEASVSDLGRGDLIRPSDHSREHSAHPVRPAP
jgi:hypothetical protein